MSPRDHFLMLSKTNFIPFFFYFLCLSSEKLFFWFQLDVDDIPVLKALVALDDIILPSLYYINGGCSCSNMSYKVFVSYRIYNCKT